MTSFPVAEIATDPDRLEEFYRAHVDAVQGFVARRAGDPATAADLTADIFVAAIDRAHTYDADRGEPRAWLFGIARTVVAMERRRHARQTRAVSRVSGRRLLEGDALLAVAERLDAERGARMLYRRIEALPPSLRGVIELVGLDGLDVTQAARVLGITPGAARVRLHRARRRLTADPPGSAPPLTVDLRGERA